MTADEFQHWLNTSQRGSRISYYRGYLIRDRSPNSAPSGSEAYRLSKLADAIMDAAYLELVYLCQERCGEFDYRYMAVRG